jgi:hypothetical protein
MATIELPEIVIDDNEDETVPLNFTLPNAKQIKNVIKPIPTKPIPIKTEEEIIEDTRKNNINIKMNILSIISAIIMIFYIIFGSYEFTNNFNITLSDLDISYSKRDSSLSDLSYNNIISRANINIDNNIIFYINSIKVQYSTIIFTLFFTIIYLQLYKYSKINHYSMNCGDTVGFFIWLPVVLNILMMMIVSFLSISPISYDKYNYINCTISKNLLLVGPIDMKIFSFLVLLSFFGPVTILGVISGVIMGIYGLITGIYDMLFHDRLI